MVEGIGDNLGCSGHAVMPISPNTWCIPAEVGRIGRHDKRTGEKDQGKERSEESRVCEIETENRNMVKTKEDLTRDGVLYTNKTALDVIS